MGAGDGLGGCHACIKYLMFAFNFIFWVSNKIFSCCRLLFQSLKLIYLYYIVLFSIESVLDSSYFALSPSFCIIFGITRYVIVALLLVQSIVDILCKNYPGVCTSVEGSKECGIVAC